MSNNDRNISIHGGIDKLDPNVSVPDSWAENSNRNIQDSQGMYTYFVKPNHSLFDYHLITQMEWKEY